MTRYRGLLEGIAAPTRATLERARRPRRFAPGDELFGVDAPATCVYHIRRGRAKVWRPLSDGQAITLAYLFEGDVPGLIALSGDGRSPSTVTAATALEADCWSAALIRTLLGRDALFARNAFDVVGGYSKILAAKLEDNMGSAERRIGRALLRLAGERGDWRAADVVTLAISRQDVADLTGSTLFTASRTLSDWQRRGMVASTRGRIALVDPKRIAAIADLAA